jgi:hypothetical protein
MVGLSFEIQPPSRPSLVQDSPHPGLPPFWGKENIEPTGLPVGAEMSMIKIKTII